MSPEFRHLGGGHGEIALPEGMAEQYPAWELHRFRWCGSERWAVRRRTPPPPGTGEYGIAAQWAGWCDAERVRAWLNGQEQAMARWQRLDAAPGARRD